MDDMERLIDQIYFLADETRFLCSYERAPLEERHKKIIERCKVQIKIFQKLLDKLEEK